MKKIAEEIIGSHLNCTCDEAYKSRNMINPGCVFCEYGSEIELMMEEYLFQEIRMTEKIENKPYNIINKICLPLKPEHRLVRWANYMSGYYGFPVYLVGSALSKEAPRDIDVCCIIPDDLFCKRYHIEDIKQHVSKKISGIWNDEHWRWSDDIIKKGYHGWDFTHMNIDFKAISETENKEQGYSDKPKLQLNTREEYAPQLEQKQEVKHGVPFNCPECGKEIQYGLSEETIKTALNSKLFKQKEDILSADEGLSAETIKLMSTKYADNKKLASNLTDYEWGSAFIDYSMGLQEGFALIGQAIPTDEEIERRFPTHYNKDENYRRQEGAKWFKSQLVDKKIDLK